MAGSSPDLGIAVIGMAGRFPGAPDVSTYWRNLRDGMDAIARFSAESARAAGVPERMLRDPGYVRAGGLLDDVAGFDAPLFGCTRREASIMDPQQRLFLECAWEALEDAGYDPARFPGRIGVYGGVSPSTYRLRYLSEQDGSPVRSLATSQLTLGTDKDYLATRVSYLLNLTGPSMTVQAACATSLAAVHLAAQTLLLHQADLMLAGGASIHLPQEAGYRYEEGGIFAPDGRCRPFDAAASGTVPGNGAGVVVLKRLTDAVRDGDRIRAVITGSAMNNDGHNKISFTAPGVGAQAEVVAEAQAVAGVDPRTVSYVEANGTGTPLGDLIEVRALTHAFRAGTPDVGFCALGSVKSGIGHLDAAAGVAGLIKTVLALENRALPPTVHFDRPNPACDLERSPFFVTDRLRPWDSDGPRTAGVCAFGIGGTNVHLIVEQAPAPPASRGPERVVLALSALTAAALSRSAANLAAHLRRHPEQELADIAHTLHIGRRELPYRLAVVVRDRDEAATALVDAAPVLATGNPMPAPADADLDALDAAARLWSAGASIDWARFTGATRRRVSLPTYPFERQRCWVEPPRPAQLARTAPSGVESLHDVVAEVWRRGFGLDREIAPEEDFFALGGRSLLMVTMATELGDRLGTRVPVPLLYDNPTFAGMTRALAAIAPSIVDDVVSVGPADPDLIPLSPEQEEIWLRYQWAPDSARNLELVLLLHGELRRDVLEDALRGMARRHPVLRATIDVVDGAPVQRIGAGAELPLSLVDIQHVPEADREAYARDLAAERLGAGFGAGEGPRWRAVVIRIGPRTHLLAGCWDELICDGRSRELIVAELLERYRAGVDGRPLDLPDLARPLAEYIAQRRAWLDGPAAAEAIRQGKAALLGAAPLPLRPNLSGPALRTFRGRRLRAPVPDPLAAALRDFCRGRGTTVYLCLLAAFDTVLARRTGRTDIVVTTNVFNRTEAAEHLLGNFTTFMLPRCTWTGDPTFAELLDQARAVTAAARARQRLPMVSVLGRLGWDDYRLVTPAGQATVQVLARATPLGITWPARAGDLTADLVRLHLGRTPSDIGVHMIESDDAMTMTVEYNTDVFPRAQAIGLRAELDTVLERIVSRPGARLSALVDGVDGVAAGVG